MQAYIELLAKKTVQVEPLLTHRFKAEEAPAAFQKLTHPGDEFLVGMLLEYSSQPAAPNASFPTPRYKPVEGQLRLGMIGAGNFGSSTLLPNLQKTGNVFFDTLCTQHGHTAQAIGDKFHFAKATCSPDDVLNNPEIQAVVIATRHDTHGPLVKAALQAGKRVFVEKPLCLALTELEEIVALQREKNLSVMVGFNRRFSPLIQALRKHLALLSAPRMIQYRINAGPLPPEHWLKDLKRGGGRIIGEFCHFLDLATYLVPENPTSVYARSLNGADSEDVAVQLSFADGSQAQLLYTAQGQATLPKEKLEVFCSGHAAVLDNFQVLDLYSPKGKKRTKLWAQNKGYAEELTAWVNSLAKHSDSPIPFHESVTSTALTFDALESLQTGSPVPFHFPSPK